MEVLVINGHDYSQYVETKGVSWSRNDVDSEKSVRTKDGRMRRDKIGTKRKVSYSVFHMTRELLAQLDDDLSEDTFSATYRDLHGTLTKEFYCSSFSATLSDVQSETDAWCDATFNIIEV